jgi:NhaA family Na+:H+ antiporter
MNLGRDPLPLVSRKQVFRPGHVIEAAQAFVAIEASSGIVLVVAALAGLIWVNSPWADSYMSLWQSPVVLRTELFSFEEDLLHLVNDGLMTVFFFLVGLEIKRELVHGQLSNPRHALLPAVAALGGMVVPALIYSAFNLRGPGANGWGIPMATDIAFSLGVLSLLGTRVPFSAKVFLLALAIADDIGAVVVIAVFYTSNIHFEAVAICVLLICLIVAFNRLGIRDVDVYLAIGLVLWLATYESGVHATLAGVALGLLTPARSLYRASDYPTTAATLLGGFQDALSTANTDAQQALLAQTEDLSRNTEAPLDRLERSLHPWVSYGIVPVFALANAGVEISGPAIDRAVSSSVSQGVAVGLLMGKPLGIFLFTWVAVQTRACELPASSSWGHILGLGLLGGIGFTVSLLITGLAFDDALLIDEAKLGILSASIAAGVLGYIALRLSRS